MYLTCTRVSKINRINFTQRFQDSDIDEVEQQIASAIQGKNSKVIIDLSELRHISCKVVVMLTGLCESLQKREGSLVLLKPSKEFISIFRENQLTTDCVMSFSLLSALNLLSRV